MEIIRILVSSDNNYLPVLGVMLHSLITARQSTTPLEIKLLCKVKTLDSQVMYKLENQLQQYANVSLHLVDVSQHYNMPMLHLGDGYVPAAYFRLLAAELLPELEKAIYLDCDLIIMGDIAELYDIDIKNHLVAAAKDTTMMGRTSSPVNNVSGYFDYLGIVNKPG